MVNDQMAMTIKNEPHQPVAQFMVHIFNEVTCEICSYSLKEVTT